MKATLRDYQSESVERVRSEFKAKKRTVLLVIPTGGGKTICFSYITDGAAAKGNRVLIIAHRKELIRQASLSLARLGVFHQIIAPRNKISAIRQGHIDELHRPYIRAESNVAVASVQTLARRIEWLQEFNPALLIPDEAHHAVAGTWKRIIEALPRSRVLGVTATPTRTDGQGLGDVFDVMVEGPSPKWMVDNGYLVPARVFRPPLGAEAERALESVGRKGKDLDAEAQAAILDNSQITGDVIKHYTELAPGRPAIVFCASVRHAEHVTARFCDAGYTAVLVIGDMDEGDRDRALAGLGDGRVQVVVSVDVISEGTDVPAAEVAILLRRTESESLYLQQVGRVLRPVFAPGHDLGTVDGRLDAIAASDKHYGLVLDHVGNTLTHGLPASERTWSLDSERRDARKKAADDDAPKAEQCPKCYHVHEPAPACTECGFVYEAKVWEAPKESDGQLMEVDETQAEIQRIQLRRQQARARSVEDLVATGMSVGQAKHRIAARMEKDRLRAELKEVCDTYVNGGGSDAEIGFTASDIMNMKPKQLRSEIDRVGGLSWGMVKNA